MFKTLMALLYKCLILDHDDTVVDSTATIHYPAHREVMRRIRPHRQPIDLKGWFLKNFHPGIMDYLEKDLRFSPDELELEYQIWRLFTTRRSPSFFEGMPETLIRYRQAGGLITVVSHSEKDIIAKHYGSHPRSEEFFPDCIFGWDYDESKRKPSSWPVDQIVDLFDLTRESILILDDLKPGVLMSRAASVSVAAAGWGHDIPRIRDYMRQNCVAYFSRVQEFQDFLIS